MQVWQIVPSTLVPYNFSKGNVILKMSDERFRRVTARSLGGGGGGGAVTIPKPKYLTGNERGDEGD